MKFLTTLTALFIFSFASAQIENLESYPKDCDSKEFKTKNGEKEYVKCSFTCYLETELTEETFKMVTWRVMPMAKYKCNFPPTFVPESLTFMEMDGEYKAIVRYTAKNAYGVPDDLTSYFTFDLEGNVTDL
jgi:hypothetical protein